MSITHAWSLGHSVSATILRYRTLAVLSATEPNDEQAVLLRDNMEVLVGVLGSVLSGLGEEKH